MALKSTPMSAFDEVKPSPLTHVDIDLIEHHGSWRSEFVSLKGRAHSRYELIQFLSPMPNSTLTLVTYMQNCRPDGCGQLPNTLEQPAMPEPPSTTLVGGRT